jgi:predicted DNA-binding protein (MmcQ/YjbR family)
MTSETVILRKLRAICGALEGVSEKTSFGAHPTFQVKKKTFAVYENQPAIHGTRIVSIKTTLPKQAALVKRGGFSPCLWGARHGWTYVDMDRTIDWSEIETLVRESHGLVSRPPKKPRKKSKPG